MCGQGASMFQKSELIFEIVGSDFDIVIVRQNPHGAARRPRRPVPPAASKASVQEPFQPPSKGFPER